MTLLPTSCRDPSLSNQGPSRVKDLHIAHAATIELAWKMALYGMCLFIDTCIISIIAVAAAVAENRDT